MNDQASKLRKMVYSKSESDSMLEKEIESKSNNKTKIITIASGKGGVGKSNFTVNLGLALQEAGKRVLLIDGDLGMANLDILLGVTPKYNLHHVITEKCNFKDAITKSSYNINLLAGFSGIDDFINNDNKKILKLLDVSSNLEEDYDIILIDVGAGMSQSVINFIIAADETEIVITPEPTSIMDSYSLMKIMAKNNYNKKMGLFFNMVESKLEAQKIYERMSEVINSYLGFEVNYLGFMEYDENVKQSVKKQHPFVCLYPDSKVSRQIKIISDKILNKNKDESATGVKSFMYRIVGFFKRDK